MAKNVPQHQNLDFGIWRVDARKNYVFSESLFCGAIHKKEILKLHGLKPVLLRKNKILSLLIMQTTNTFYQLEAEGLTGEKIRMKDFRGKKVMIVNVASACGYTPQYSQLEELYRNFKDHLVIIGFPCNDFGHQESGTAEEIRAFCDSRYKITFPMAEKVVIAGENRHPVFNWLMNKDLNGVSDAEVRWNFHKFLIDENGHWLQSFPSSVSPLDEDLLRYFEADTVKRSS